MKQRILPLILIFLVNFLPGAAQQKFYMSTTGNDANDGTELSPVATFTKAINLVNDYVGITEKTEPVEVELHIEAGTYSNYVGGLNCKGVNLTISGESPATTILSRNSVGRLLRNDANHQQSSNILTIKNLTFKGGFVTNGDGGSFTIVDAAQGRNTLNIENCYFEDNRAVRGGAFSFVGHSLNVNNCHFKNNMADQTGTSNDKDGGAIFLIPLNNSSGMQVTISNSTFESNFATTKGGAIGLLSNTAGSGAPNSSLTITNCVFYKNMVSAPEYQGAACHLLTTAVQTNALFDLKIVNSTFYHNGRKDDSTQKNAIQLDGNRYSGMVLINNIMIPETGATSGITLDVNRTDGGALVTGKNNLIESISGNVSSVDFTTGAETSNNLLGDHEDDIKLKRSLTTPSVSVYQVPYLELEDGSIAIDAGINNYGTPDIVPDSDIRGKSIINALKDIGAFEYEGPTTGIINNFGEKSQFSCNVTNNEILFNDILTDIEIFSLAGCKMIEKHNINARNVDISELPAGIYILKASIGNNSQVQKITK